MHQRVPVFPSVYFKSLGTYFFILKAEFVLISLKDNLIVGGRVLKYFLGAF